MLGLTLVPRRSEMTTANSDGLKLGRAETELRKCLSTDTDELLLKGYACAWQKEILVQGHIYITSRHFCFYSSILGWETKTVINVSDVTSIKKDKTAHLFPNAVMISTSNKKYGFSTFAHRNKAFNILQLVWQNALSEQPAPQEQLAVRIKSLKNKSKSVENSPITTPRHSRKPLWQLSLRGSSKNSHTDSESSGTDSPILLSHGITSTPSPSSSTILPPSLPNGGTSSTVPRVTVTTSESARKSHTHQSGVSSSDHTPLTPSGSITNPVASNNQQQSSSESLFADATDGKDNLSAASDSALHEAMSRPSSSNTSDTESYLELQRPRKRMSARKTRSPSIIGLTADMSESLLERGNDDDDGIVFRTTDGEVDREHSDPLRGSGPGESVTSALNQILDNVHFHPTRNGLWRLQSGLQDWCTPSNFINLLIVISIFLLLISTASMVCKLSYVSPTFQPLLAWQPWCKLCSECGISKNPPNGMVTVENNVNGLSRGGGRKEGQGKRGGLWTIELFEELVKKHENDPQIDGFHAGAEVSNSRLDDLNSNEGGQSTL